MRCGALLVTTMAAAGLVAHSPTPAIAASNACAAVGEPAAAHLALTPETRGAVAAYKARHDTLRLEVDLARSAPAAVAAQVAGHRSARRTPSPTSRSAPCAAAGWMVLANLNQQGQVTDYYCGPATVSEMAATRGGRVDQATAAGWMGTDADSGTSVDQLTQGLNHFVGEPQGGTYWFVSLSYDPTDDERSAFVARLRSDLTTYGGWPVAGDAWEVPGGPHLIGHPDVEIFHWIEIGGLGDGDAATYYADSATTVWSGVPAYSWLDLQAMVTILGGRGYAW